MRRPGLVLVLVICQVIGFSACSSALAAPGQAKERPQIVVPDPPDSPVRLSPLSGSTAGGGVSTMSASIGTYRITTPSGSWASLRNFHQQLFIGSVADGWTLHYLRPHLWSRMGFFAERYFCGWVLTESLTNIGGSGVSTPCATSWSLPVMDFTQYVNCDGCNGGFQAFLTRNVTAIRNVYPWHSGPGTPPGAPTDPSVTLNNGEQFNWRYLSENGEWVAGTTVRNLSLIHI